MFGVGYAVCSHGRVVADLFRDELGLTSIILPGAEEELAQERIQRLLLAPQLIVPRRVLLFEGGEEPLEHKKGPFGWIWLLSGGNEDSWVFCPVGAELGQGGCAENESWGCQGREIAIEGCN